MYPQYNIFLKEINPQISDFRHNVSLFFTLKKEHVEEIKKLGLLFLIADQ
jgi:hypothetical protein